MELHQIIRRPLVTEKTTVMREGNQYIFEVDPRANKNQIKEAVETAFPNVTVLDVNVMKMPRKSRRNMRVRRTRFTSIWKKAIVTIPADQRIDVVEGV